MLFHNEDLPEVSEASLSDFMQAYFAFQQMSEEEILGRQFSQEQYQS